MATGPRPARSSRPAPSRGSRVSRCPRPTGLGRGRHRAGCPLMPLRRPATFKVRHGPRRVAYDDRIGRDGRRAARRRTRIVASSTPAWTQASGRLERARRRTIRWPYQCRHRIGIAASGPSAPPRGCDLRSPIPARQGYRLVQSDAACGEGPVMPIGPAMPSSDGRCRAPSSSPRRWTRRTLAFEDIKGGNTLDQSVLDSIRFLDALPTPPAS